MHASLAMKSPTIILGLGHRFCLFDMKSGLLSSQIPWRNRYFLTASIRAITPDDCPEATCETRSIPTSDKASWPFSNCLLVAEVLHLREDELLIKCRKVLSCSKCFNSHKRRHLYLTHKPISPRLPAQKTNFLSLPPVEDLHRKIRLEIFWFGSLWEIGKLRTRSLRSRWMPNTPRGTTNFAKICFLRVFFTMEDENLDKLPKTPCLLATGWIYRLGASYLWKILWMPFDLQGWNIMKHVWRVIWARNIY